MPFTVGIFGGYISDEDGSSDFTPTPKDMRNEVWQSRLRRKRWASMRRHCLTTPTVPSLKNQGRTTMNAPNRSAPTPSLKALEAAAMVRLAAMVKDGDKKPSLEALQITARMMAEKTHRELLVRER